MKTGSSHQISHWRSSVQSVKKKTEGGHKDHMIQQTSLSFCSHSDSIKWSLIYIFIKIGWKKVKLVLMMKHLISLKVINERLLWVKTKGFTLFDVIKWTFDVINSWCCCECFSYQMNVPPVLVSTRQWSDWRIPELADLVFPVTADTPNRPRDDKDLKIRTWQSEKWWSDVERRGLLTAKLQSVS